MKISPCEDDIISVVAIWPVIIVAEVIFLATGERSTFFIEGIVLLNFLLGICSVRDLVYFSRTIELSQEGCAFSVWKFHKKYQWNDLTVQLCNDENFAFRDSDKRGPGLLICPKAAKYRHKMAGMTYCRIMHPFSSVYLRFRGHEQKIFLKDYGTKIDLLNLQWIYRAKKYYHMLPPDIYSMTIPIHYRIKVEEFKTLVETPTLEQFEAEVEKTYYAGKYNYMQTDKTLEQMYRDCLRKLYLTDKRNDPYSIAIVNTYLFLKEEEIYKLTTALECIRYGLTKGETLGYLGGVNQ